MISPHVQRYLGEHLQGQRSSDETREILRLIDDTGALDAEFDSVLGAISQKIPGLAIDFDKLLTGDEIECDPLISQGNLALLRLDAIYHQAFQAWTKSGGGLHTIKIITKPENPATYSDRTQQHVRTEETYPPHAQLLNQVVNITLSAFRVQATITHRRDQLKHPSLDQPLARRASEGIDSPSQPEASARDASQSKSPSNTSPDIITADEIFNSDFGGLSAPIEGKFPLLIRGVNKIGILKGYDKIEPLTKTGPVTEPIVSPTRKRGNATPTSAESAFRTEIDATNQFGAPCSDCGTPRSEHAEAANNVSQQSREEEPVNLKLSAPSAYPGETNAFTHNQPSFHKRE